MTKLQESEQAVDLVVAHKFPWCRARLLHALAGADEQGILSDVLDELGLGQSDIDWVRSSLAVWRRETLNPKKIAKALGAEHRGKVSAKSGHFGAMQLVAEVQVPSGYQRMKPFLVWWVRRCGHAHTPWLLVHSLAVGGAIDKDPKVATWRSHLTAFRRLREDARVRLVKRFLLDKDR